MVLFCDIVKNKPTTLYTIHNTYIHILPPLSPPPLFNGSIKCPTSSTIKQQTILTIQNIPDCFFFFVYKTTTITLCITYGFEYKSYVPLRIIGPMLPHRNAIRLPSDHEYHLSFFGKSTIHYMIVRIIFMDVLCIYVHGL